MSNNPDTLEPCPFCPDGGTPQAHTDAEYVTCKTCGCVVEYAVWQTRAAPSVEGVVAEQIHYDCGCVTCVCSDEEQCHGCGATSCKGFMKDETCKSRPVRHVKQPQTDNSAALEALDRVFEIITELESDLYGGTSESDFNEYCRLGIIIRTSLGVKNEA